VGGLKDKLAGLEGDYLWGRTVIFDRDFGRTHLKHEAKERRFELSRWERLVLKKA
jgi:hypothetical protein